MRSGRRSHQLRICPDPDSRGSSGAHQQQQQATAARLFRSSSSNGGSFSGWGTRIRGHSGRERAQLLCAISPGADRRRHTRPPDQRQRDHHLHRDDDDDDDEEIFPAAARASSAQKPCFPPSYATKSRPKSNQHRSPDRSRRLSTSRPITPVATRATGAAASDHSAHGTRLFLLVLRP